MEFVDVISRFPTRSYTSVDKKTDIPAMCIRTSGGVIISDDSLVINFVEKMTDYEFIESNNDIKDFTDNVENIARYQDNHTYIETKKNWGNIQMVTGRYLIYGDEKFVENMYIKIFKLVQRIKFENIDKDIEMYIVESVRNNVKTYENFNVDLNNIITENENN